MWSGLNNCGMVPNMTNWWCTWRIFFFSPEYRKRYQDYIWKVSVITINNIIIVERVSKLCAVAVNLHLPVCLFVWTCATNTVCTFPHVHVEMFSCSFVCCYSVFKYLFVWTFATHTVCTFPHKYMWQRTHICTRCVLLTCLDICHTLCVYIHTLHIVCCKCLCNLFRHISVRGHLPHSLISIHVDFEYFFWEKSIFEI